MEKVNQKMKKFNLRGVLVGLRSSVTTPQKSDVGIEESLRSEHFQMTKTICHGFPYQPTSLACDPVQNILAIGNKTGTIKIFGRPGVEYDVRHENNAAVNQLIFLINEGSLVSVTADDQLHLWTIRQKRPELVHSLKFQRERISICHLPFQSKWLYVGTERGNVQIVNLESFTLSGYIINWNKAMDLIRLAHPGPVVHLSDNPIDPNKLLIGFDTGSVVLWDFKNKTAEMRFSCSENLKSVCWHQDGRQFICSHADGSLTVWNTKQTQRPQSYMMPHAKLGKDGRPEQCKAIPKVDYRSVRNGEPFIIFSGGTINTSNTPSLTVMHGNNMTVLEMEHTVIDFLLLCSTPWNNDFQDPHAIVVLLQNDLVVVDLTTPGYPCFENPYPMDIHESPVTACSYFADCPLDLVSAFYSVGCRRNRTGYSEKEWPIHGGESSQISCSYPEIIVTGHADGSVKFWDASSVTLQILYKLKTAKVFDPTKCRLDDDDDDSPFAVQHIHLCVDSRLLCIAGSTHVVLFRFSKQEATVEFPVLDISIVYEVCDGTSTPDMEYPVMFSSKQNLTHQSGSIGSYTNIGPTNGKESITSVKARSGPRKWPAGYQPDLCCLLTWIDNESAPPITSLSVNSKFGLLAFGDECGVAVVDIVQRTCLLSMGTPDLYGSLDPYSRAPRSPKLKTSQKLSTLDHLSQTTLSDDCRSPTVEQQHSVSHQHKSTTRTKDIYRKKKEHHHAVKGDKKSAYKTMSCPSGGEGQSSLQDVAVDRLGSLQENQTEDMCVDEDLRNYIFNMTKTSTDLASAAKRMSERVSGMFDFNQVEHSNSGINERKQSVTTLKVGKEFVDEGNYGDDDDDDGADEEDIDTYFKDYVDARKAPSCGNEESLDNILGRNWKVPGSDWKISDQSECTTDRVTSTNNFKTPQLSPSRSVSMLKKLVTKKRSNFISNKSVSEDLSGNVEATDGPRAMPVHAVDSKHLSTPDVYKFENVEATCYRSITNKSISIESDHAGGGIEEKKESKGFSRLMSEIFYKVVGTNEESKMKSHHKFEVIDLSADNDHPISVADKSESSFCRSHSSSTTSLENVNKESVVCLVFAEAYTRKSDALTCPCLWIGTSLGTVLVISLTLPSDSDLRRREPVIISPSGTIFRLKGSIINISFLDCNGILIPSVAEQWKDVNNKEYIKDERRSPYNRQSPAFRGRMSPSSSIEMTTDKQYSIICSEKQARVISLPSQTCVYKVKVTEMSSVARADIISFRDSVCLACYVANGHVVVFSLPSLKPLLDVDCIATPSIRVSKTICFSNNANGIYMCSPNEIQKITLSAEICDLMKENMKDLYLPCTIPEAPKQSFFKNLFGGPTTAVDREELFGESSGKPSKGTTKYTPGPAGISQEANSATSEISRAKMAAIERGEKLGELEERTERMKMEAEVFSQSAHQLKIKYKDKKWYQF